jgi:hypothetical protein
MSNQIPGSSEPVDDHPKTQEVTPEVISQARRWILKAGVTAVPIILTLRSKPLFGQTQTTVGKTNCSAWMSASRLSASYQLSHHLTNPGPEPPQCKQLTGH